MKRASLRNKLSISLAAAVLMVSGLLVSAPNAMAAANDAVVACGATNVIPGQGAAVPSDAQGKFFQYVPAQRDPAPILCGNGTTTGAVHIEVKHNVPNWAEAVTAISKAIDRGVPNPRPEETRYSWTFRPGKTIEVVVGDASVITALPVDGLADTWTEASVA